MLENGPLNVINLVDSPGHCDFSGEVEAALRVCDGAIVVVDVVEGVCVQTITVLRTALERGVRPVLVLNKIDRLFVELQLDPLEAYHQIQRVLEQVNVIMGVREVEDMMARADVQGQEQGQEQEQDNDEGTEWAVEKTDGKDSADESISGYFSPERGNVAFASAIDGWAFRLNEFAALFSKKFGLSEKVLMKSLWGEYYLHAKSKRISKRKPSSLKSGEAKPMFVQFILYNLHSVYDAIYSSQNDVSLALTRRENIVSKLQLKVNSRDVKHKDASVALRAIMNAWLPAAPGLLNLIVDKLPNTADALRNHGRLSFVWPHTRRVKPARAPFGDVHPDTSDAESLLAPIFEEQHRAITACDPSAQAPLLAYVTKMFDVSSSQTAGNAVNIRYPRSREDLQETLRGMKNTESRSDKTAVGTESTGGLIAFARIFSGTLSVGDTVHVYSPRYQVAQDGSFDASLCQDAEVKGLFILMGRNIDAVSSASAGAVVGIAGLGDVILKTATISSVAAGKCLPLMSARKAGGANDSVVRVAVEPHFPSDMARLQDGLRKLNQADPAVDTYVTAHGEHVIAASGELHLERCLCDLRQRFAKDIEIHVSPPIIAFRETVLGGRSSMDEGKDTGAKQHQKFFAGDASNDVESGIVGKEGIVVRERQATDMSSTQNSVPASSWRVSLCGEKPASKVINPSMSSYAKRGSTVEVGNSSLNFSVTAAALPPRFAAELDNIGAVVRELSMYAGDVALESVVEDFRARISDALSIDAEAFQVKAGQRDAFVRYWTHAVLGHTWSLGPRRFGSNILVGPWPCEGHSPWLRAFLRPKTLGADVNDSSSDQKAVSRADRDLEKAIATGFQVATQAGPLCDEPMHGVVFFIESIVNTYSKAEGEESDVACLPSSISGLAISSSKEAMRMAVTHGNPRIMEAALRVEVSVSEEALGRVYTVLAKRRGRVLAEDMKDGVNIFGIEAILPLTESFGFADALRKQTSGFASAQMVFSHWEAVDADPFWAPRTEEELEDLGLEDSTEWNNNLARKLISAVRRRKGLKIEEKIVKNAEKQRTLSKKK